MKNIFKIIFALVFFIVVLGGEILIFKTNNSAEKDYLQAKIFLDDFYKYDKFSEGEKLILNYFNQEDNQKKEAKETIKQKKKILGGIVSHHVPLAFPLIADFYRSIREENPKTIFILGPDHFHKASSRIVSTDLQFYTPFGYLETNKSIINELKKENLIKIDNQAFKNEHSILSQIFFIKYLFPEAKIVPLIFQPELGAKDAKNIAEVLKPYKENSIFIASVDFSHYLSFTEAQAADKETKEKLESFYFENLDIKDCDSPVSIQTLFFLAEEEYNFKVLEEKNSADFSQSKDITTGYISAIFEK